MAYYNAVWLEGEEQWAVKIGKHGFRYVPSTKTSDKAEAEYRAKVLECERNLTEVRAQMGSLRADDAKTMAQMGYGLILAYDRHPENDQYDNDPHAFLA